MSVTPLVPKSFEEFRFRRALHHVAMNVVAWKEGAESVLRPEFDPVRRYIRTPKRSEAWPFAVLMLGGTMYSEVDVEVRDHGDSLVVAMLLVGGIFYVDLFAGTDFPGFIEGKRRRRPRLRYVSEEERLPRDEPSSDGRRYRMNIYDE